MRRKQLVGLFGFALVASIALLPVFGIGRWWWHGNPFKEIWETIWELQDRVETLENQMPLEGFLRAPIYDSGWIWTPPLTTTYVSTGLNLTNKNYLIYGLTRPTLEYDEWSALYLPYHNATHFRIGGESLGYWVRVQIWIIQEP